MACTEKPRYHTIRRADSLNAPAIFMAWSDCKFCLDQASSESVEYQSFHFMSEAMQYINEYYSAAANSSALRLEEPSADGEENQDYELQSRNDQLSTKDCLVDQPLMSIVEHQDAIDRERRRYDQMYNELHEEISKLKETLETDAQIQRAIESADHVENPPGTPKKTGKKKAPTESSTRDESSKKSNSPASRGKRKKSNSSRERYKRKTTVEERIRDYQREAWDARFQELVEFKNKFGHCNVSCRKASHIPYKSLATWVSDQRSSHRYLREGKQSALFPERIRRLREIGFQWNLQKFSNYSFEERCQQLIAYRDEHGDCDVPQKHPEPEGLGNFVIEMRRRYKQMKAGKNPKDNRLTEERMERLNSIGIKWSLRNRRSPEEMAEASKQERDLSDLFY